MISNHDPVGAWPLWHSITRLGEAQLLAPLVLFIVVVVAVGSAARSGAMRWAALVGTAALLTIATKVAFVGWGIGSATLNFMGISGHTMFAAAVYPSLLVALCSGGSGVGLRRVAFAAGCGVALLVGLSRIYLGAHSLSEVVAGWIAGGLVSLSVLVRPIALPAQLNVGVLAAVVGWFAFVPASTTTVDTHSIITRIALKVSGHERPFTRQALLRARA